MADLIPVDVAINAMIVAAWKTAQDYTGNPMVPPVYNVTSGSINPINWGKYIGNRCAIDFHISSQTS